MIKDTHSIITLQEYGDYIKKAVMGKTYKTHTHTDENKKYMKNFMFMGPCIVGYENHISNQQDATLYAPY
jgi:hypothetical protein